MTIRAVVFDMDGVLVDAREWHYEALNRALAHVGCAISRFDHLVTYDGLPTRDKLEMLTLEHGLPRSLHGFLNGLKQRYTMDIVATQCRPTFAHEYALSRLRHDGLRLAVASNSVRPSVEAIMDKTALATHLEFTLSNEDVTRAKPDPEIYLQAIERLRLTPREVLVVEDNDKGVRAATTAGAHVLTVRGPGDVTYEAICAEMRFASGHAA
ncbi:MAG TPA: HAD family phosphatase [Jatrophihabitantaceae bacterium]|nr:HAD family phosphatase [Jatrophihabitantaceae bacterium]